MEELPNDVLDIKNNTSFTYLEKLERLAALRAKNPFPVDEAFMRKFAESESLAISLDESVTAVWKKVQEYNDVLEKYKLPNIHASDFSQIQEALKLRAAEEIPAKIREVIKGDVTYLSKLKKLKGLYWSYRGLGDIKPTDFFCSESELNIDSQDNVKALAQLAEYKTLFQLLDIDVANFAAFKQAEAIVQQRVQEKYNHDIDAIMNSSGSPLEKLKAAKEVFDRNDSNKFLTHEKMAGLVDVLKAIEFSSDANYIDQLAQLKEYQVFCASLKLPQGEAVIKEKIKNLKFDLNAAVVLAEIQSINGNPALSAAEKLSRLNLLLGQCSENGVKLLSATKAYFNETVKELSNQVAAQLIDTSRQKFLEIDWDIFSKDPTKTSVTKYAADLTMFVQKTIVGNTNKVAASLSIGQWLHIANECVKNRDYHSAHAICQAFTTSAVDRVMAIVATEEEKQILDQLRILFPAKEGAVSRLAIAASAQAEKDVVPSLIYPATQIGNAYAAAEGIGGKADRDVLAKIISSSQDIQRDSQIPKKKEFNDMQFSEFVSDDGLYALSLETMPRLDDEGKQREKERIVEVREGLNTFLAADEKELSSLIHPLEVQMLAAQVFKVFDEQVSKGVREKAEKDKKSFIDRIVELDVGKKPKVTEKSTSTSAKEINRKIGEIKELLLKVKPGVHNEELNDKMIDLIQALELKAKTTKSGDGKKNVIERNIQVLRAVANELKIDVPKAEMLGEMGSLEVGAPIQKPGLLSNVFSAVSRMVTGIFSPAQVTEVSSVPAPSGLAPLAPVVQPSIPAPPAAPVQEQSPPVFLPKPTADEFLAAVKANLGKEKSETNESDISVAHKAVCESFKVRFPNVTVEQLKNMSEADYGKLIRGEFEQGRVQGETTQVTEDASKTPEEKRLAYLTGELNDGVNGFLKKFYADNSAKFFENFTKHFLALGQKIDQEELGFTAQDIADLFTRLQNFVERIEEINKQKDEDKDKDLVALEKAEEIAVFLEANPSFYVDANNAVRWLTALSEKFPDAAAKFSTDARLSLGSFAILFTQWLPKYPLIFREFGKLEKYRDESSPPNLLGKRFEAFCKQYDLVLEKIIGEEELTALTEKSFRLKKSSTIPAKEINQKFNEVHAGIKLLNRDQLDAAGKLGLLNDIDALLAMYAKKLVGGTSAENKKTIVNNIPALLFFAKQINPFYNNEVVLKQLGTNIASLGSIEELGTSSVSLLLKMETVVPRPKSESGDEVVQRLSKALEEQPPAALAGKMLDQIEEGELLYVDKEESSEDLNPEFAPIPKPLPKQLSDLKRTAVADHPLAQTSPELLNFKDALVDFYPGLNKTRLQQFTTQEIVAFVIQNPEWIGSFIDKKSSEGGKYRAELAGSPALIEKMINVPGKAGEILREGIQNHELLNSRHFETDKKGDVSLADKKVWKIYLDIILNPNDAVTPLTRIDTKALFSANPELAKQLISSLLKRHSDEIDMALQASGVLALFDDQYSKDSNRRDFESEIHQHIEESVDRILASDKPAQALHERLQNEAFRQNLDWHSSRVGELQQIEGLEEKDATFLKEIVKPVQERVVEKTWTREEIEQAISRIKNVSLKVLFQRQSDSVPLSNMGARDESYLLSMVDKLNKATEDFGGEVPSYWWFKDFLSEVNRQHSGLAAAFNVPEDQYKFQSDEMDINEWQQKDFLYLVNTTEFGNKALQAFLKEKIQAMRQLPIIDLPANARSLRKFVTTTLAAFSSDSYEMYRAKVNGAPASVFSVAKDLFSLSEEEFYRATHQLKPAPKVSTNIRAEKEKVALNLIERIIKNDDLKALLSYAVKHAWDPKGGLDEHAALEAVLEQMALNFGDRLPSYDEYNRFYLKHSAGTKWASLFEIEKGVYERFAEGSYSEPRVEVPVSSEKVAERVQKAAPVSPPSKVADEQEDIVKASGTPGKTMEMEEISAAPQPAKKTSNPLRAAIDRLKTAVAPKVKEGAVEQIEKIARENATLSSSNIEEVNKLLEGFAEDVNSAREKSGNRLFYPLDDMSRIVAALAPRNNAEGLDIQAIQSILPPDEVVSAYLKAEEAKLDSIIDSLPEEDFSAQFEEYFHPDDPKYKDFYAVGDKASKLEAGTSERTVKAYTFRDILKKCFTVGVQSQGGQSGIVRDQVALQTIESFRNENQNSEDPAVRLICALTDARAGLAEVGMFNRAREVLSDDLDAAGSFLKLPKDRLENYQRKAQEIEPARLAYLAQKNIQNGALAAALKKVIKYFGEEAHDLDDLSDNFIVETNLVISKDAKMPDAFLNNCMKFVELIQGKWVDGKKIGGEITESEAQHRVRKALIVAVVKGDINYALNPKGFEAIDANLLQAKTYQLELANAIKVVQRKFAGSALTEIETLREEKKRVDQHVEQLSGQLKQVRQSADVARDEAKAAETQRKADTAEASMLRTLDEFESETPARKWVSPKLPKKSARKAEASSNEKILEGIENSLLRDAMLFELERKGIDLTKDVDLAEVEAAIKNINAEIPPGQNVMPNEFLKKYAAFLKHASPIPGISGLKSEFIVAVITQNKSLIKEKDFSERLKAAKNYDKLNVLHDEIGQALKEIDDYSADVLKARDALHGYLPEDGDEIKSLDAESQRLFNLREKYVEQRKVVAEKRRAVLFEQNQALQDSAIETMAGKPRAQKSDRVPEKVEAWMETETVSVSVKAISLKITMTTEKSETSITPAEKGKLLSVIVFNPEEINPDDRLKTISGNERKMQKALESGKHVIAVKNDSVSYTQPKDADALPKPQMEELVRKMVQETYKKFEPKSVSDITFEGSKKLQEMAKTMMQVEIDHALRAKGKEEMGPAKAAEPKRDRPTSHK